jgi:hypothetical protein
MAKQILRRPFHTASRHRTRARLRARTRRASADVPPDIPRYLHRAAGRNPSNVGDEFLARPGLRFAGLATCGNFQTIFSAGEGPFVGQAPDISLRLRPMTHRQRHVILVIKDARGPGDGTTRNQFLDENHTAPPAARRLPFDVEAKIHLLEIGMKRNCDSFKPRVQKVKPDHADKSFALPLVEFRPGGQEWLKHSGINLVIQHHEQTPLGSEEGSRHVHSSLTPIRTTAILKTESGEVR